MSLSGSAEVITLRMVASTGQVATFTYFSVHCSADVEFTEEYDGTFSSGTTLTVNKRARDDAGQLTATHTTTIASTNVLHRHKCTAGQTFVFRLQELRESEELTIRTESATADVTFNAEYHER